jgi:hypothetical protein
MKRNVVIKNVKSVGAALKIMQNNYPAYRMDKKPEKSKVNSGITLYHMHLQEGNDRFSSLHAHYHVEKQELEISRNNGNQIRKYRELFSPVA